MSVPQSLLCPPLSRLPRCSTTREVQQPHTRPVKPGLLLTDHDNHSTNPWDVSLRTSRPSAFLYHTLIRAHTQSGHHDRALLLFDRMLSEGDVPPDRFTLPLVLKACAELSAIDEGEQVHCMALKARFLHGDVFVHSSLVRMYLECGRVDEAHRVFEAMPHRNVVTWNSMIAGFAKSGDIDSARRCFDEMPDRNVVSWNSMIGAYVQNSMPDEALRLFLELQVLGMVPDEATMVSVVSAISDLGLLKLGWRAHGYITRRRFSLDGALGVALINMYTKCGRITAAFRVFSTISVKNVGHWTSMTVGFAAHGLAEASLQVFSEMLSSGVEPNYVTFIGVLNACSHGGLVDEGLKCFELMRSCGIEPRIQHYGCMVDLLGRSGHLEEAMELVLKLPMEPGFVIWGALLSACRDYGNVKMAEVSAQKLIEQEADRGSCYILLSNLYAGLGRWEDFSRVRKMMEERGVDKVTGFSWIEVNDRVHKFVAGDRFHVRSMEIYSMLHEIECNLGWAGYEPLTWALATNSDIIEEEDIHNWNAL